MRGRLPAEGEDTGVEVDFVSATQGNKQDLALRSQGIRPLARSTFGQNDQISGVSPQNGGKEAQIDLRLDLIETTVHDIFSPEVGGWVLPGHGDPYPSCGEKLILGCLGPHRQANLDREVVGRVFVDMRRRTCLRASCPVCYEKWAGKQAHKVEYRFKFWRRGGRAIHVVLSAPSNLYHLSLVDLRRKAISLAKEVGVFGGSIIIHPWRERCKICGSNKDFLTKRCQNCGGSEFYWVVSPHFHIIGFGWIYGDRVVAVYEKSGWVTRNIGIRISVGATILYQLSHCGIHDHHHSLTWFGAMSYNKMGVPPEPVEKEKCPLCGADLVRLRWVGEGEMPFKDEGKYFDLPGNWVQGYGGSFG